MVVGGGIGGVASRSWMDGWCGYSCMVGGSRGGGRAGMVVGSSRASGGCGSGPGATGKWNVVAFAFAACVRWCWGMALNGGLLWSRCGASFGLWVGEVMWP